MRDWTVYVGAYGGVLLATLIYSLLEITKSANTEDQLFGISLVLLIDKVIANPFWRK